MLEALEHARRHDVLRAALLELDYDVMLDGPSGPDLRHARASSPTVRFKELELSLHMGISLYLMVSHYLVMPRLVRYYQSYYQ